MKTQGMRSRISSLTTSTQCQSISLRSLVSPYRLFFGHRTNQILYDTHDSGLGQTLLVQKLKHI